MIKRTQSDSWRAGCSVTGTSGSEGGSRKRTGSKDRQRASVRPYVVLVKGTGEQAQALLTELTERVEGLGLRLAPAKTGITHIDEGFRFLGMRIVRLPKGPKRYVYTFVSNEALASVKRKVKALTGRSTTNLELSVLLKALNPILRGWAGYFRYAAAKRTFCYLGNYAWWRVMRWLRKKHPRMS